MGLRLGTARNWVYTPVTGSDAHKLGCAIHQVNLFPRLKVLQKIAIAGLWIMLDDVQFVEREWQNRCRVRFYAEPQQMFWLTAPVHRPGGRISTIDALTIMDPTSLKMRFFKSLRCAYGRSPYWSWIEEYAEHVLLESNSSFLRLALASTTSALDMLNLSRPVIASSSLAIEAAKTSRLVKICQAVGATKYISGSGGQRYLEVPQFSRCGITVCWQEWLSPVGAVPNLTWRDVSFIDFVARAGPTALRRHLLEDVRLKNAN
jgi:WbqC-like protein family